MTKWQFETIAPVELATAVHRIEQKLKAASGFARMLNIAHVRTVLNALYEYMEDDAQVGETKDDE